MVNNMFLLDNIKEYVLNDDINIFPYLINDIEETKKVIPLLSDLEFVKISDYFLMILDYKLDNEFIDIISDRFLDIKDNSLDLYSLYQIIKSAKELVEEEY